MFDKIYHRFPVKYSISDEKCSLATKIFSLFFLLKITLKLTNFFMKFVLLLSYDHHMKFSHSKFCNHR